MAPRPAAAPLGLLLLAALTSAAAAAPKLNLLYFIVDDLRPELEAYGVPAALTAGSPNIAALAKEGLVFERAYAQQAVCGPSRNSFLSGRRPPTTQTYTFANSFRDVGPDWTSMLGFFKSKGYSVAGVGKIYHPHSPPLDDGAKSWSEAFLPYPEWSQGGDPCPGGPDHDAFAERPARRRAEEGGAPTPADQAWGPACPMPDDANLTDTNSADVALADLAALTKSPNPFVMAVGFHSEPCTGLPILCCPSL